MGSALKQAKEFGLTLELEQVQGFIYHVPFESGAC
jgi:hypothetical protein